MGFVQIAKRKSIEFSNSFLAIGGEVKRTGFLFF